MKRVSIKERAKKVPADIKLAVARSMATAKLISKILEKQGKTQKDLAVLMGKKESEVSKWLRGTHNFTYRTISKIEIALGEQLILTADQSSQNINIVQVVASDNREQALLLEGHTVQYIAVDKSQQFSISQSAVELIAGRTNAKTSNFCFEN